MRQKLSDEEIHWLYCPVKNRKSALFLVVCFSVTAFLSWKGLHKAPERPSLFVLLFGILLFATLGKTLTAFRCLRERLVFGVVIVSLVTGAAAGFAPSIFSKHLEMVRSGKLALSVLGLLVSLTMLVQSARRPNVGPSNTKTSIASQPKQNLPILVVVILAALALGVALYLLPFRQ